ARVGRVVEEPRGSDRGDHGPRANAVRRPAAPRKGGAGMTTGLITAKVERRELLLGGAWRDTAQRVAVRYPYTGEVVAEVADAGPGEVEAAIDAAVRAFPTTRSLPAYRRAEILLRAAAAIQERAAFLARQIVFETGNPIGEAQGEVARTAAIFQMAGEEA